MIKTIAAAVMAVSLFTASHADAGGKDKAKPTKAANKEGFSVISPIFGQLVAFTLPAEFTTLSENGNSTSYIREAVLSGETLDKWTQMVTVTGAKGLASKAGLTPKVVAGFLADGFRKSCPTSYNAELIQEGKLDRVYDQITAVVSCGNSPDTGLSESALIMVIKGEKDYYTIQWAERDSPSPTPIPVDKAKWKARLAKLSPVNLCPVIPGEAAPYPSCMKKR